MEENTISMRVGRLFDDVENPTFNKQNPHFKNDYADLAQCLNVKSLLASHGFTLYQSLKTDGRWQTSLVDIQTGTPARTVVTPFIVEKQSPQAVGSALTYYRRYGILLLLNLVGEADDDGEKAEGRGGSRSNGNEENW